MKICYDYEIFWKQKFSSVASRYYFNLIKHLSYNQGLKIKIFASIYLNERIENLSSNILTICDVKKCELYSRFKKIKHDGRNKYN